MAIHTEPFTQKESEQLEEWSRLLNTYRELLVDGVVLAADDSPAYLRRLWRERALKALYPAE